MTSLLNVYASLCHIYAEQWGGLEYQLSLDHGSDTVNKAISHNDTSIQNTVNSAQMVDPHCLFRRRFYLQSKVCYTTVCKAHLLTIEPVLISEAASSFSLDYFEPYGETINAMERCLHDIKALPSDFFGKFSNIQVLQLSECDKLTEIPPKISKCCQLEKLVVEDSAVTTLPADLFEISELMVLELRNLPLSSLPSNVPTSGWLTKLILSGLQLLEIPPALGNLTELVELDLNHNALSDLPMDLQKLQRLRVLHLCGKCPTPYSFIFLTEHAVQ